MRPNWFLLLKVVNDMIDAELYTISIRKEYIGKDTLYVARVAELPDVEEYADTYEEAYSLVRDTIEISNKLCLENNIPFPEPRGNQKKDSMSGRVTLRMPKSLHFYLSEEASNEDVSLNQYIVSSLSNSYGQCQMSRNVSEELKKINSSITGVGDFAVKFFAHQSMDYERKEAMWYSR